MTVVKVGNVYVVIVGKGLLVLDGMRDWRRRGLILVQSMSLGRHGILSKVLDLVRWTRGDVMLQQETVGLEYLVTLMVFICAFKEILYQYSERS